MVEVADKADTATEVTAEAREAGAEEVAIGAPLLLLMLPPLLPFKAPELGEELFVLLATIVLKPALMGVEEATTAAATAVAETMVLAALLFSTLLVGVVDVAGLVVEVELAFAGGGPEEGSETALLPMLEEDCIKELS